MVGGGFIHRQSGAPLGIAIGGMLILFFKVLYGDSIDESNVRNCDKCGSRLHPGIKYCGECGYKRSLIKWI